MSTFHERLKNEVSLDGDSKPILDSQFGAVLVLYTGGTIGMKRNDDLGKLKELCYALVISNWRVGPGVRGLLHKAVIVLAFAITVNLSG